MPSTNSDSIITAGAVGGAPARLVVPSLGLIVQELFAAGLAASSQRTYRSGERRYVTFCQAYNLVPFPATEPVLAAFVAMLYTQGLASGTVKSYLAAVRHAQIAIGQGDPQIGAMPQLEYVLKGLKRRTSGRQQRTRLPITPAILRQLKEVWSRMPDRHNAAMLWAAATLCFFGFLRMGEAVVPAAGYDPAVHLSYTDAHVNDRSSPEWMGVRIKASKTDPFRRGITIYIGATGEDLCPVAALLGYMVLRGNREGPMFVFANGDHLTRNRFVTQLRRALSAAGVDCRHYAGHSFRIGAATTASMCGMQDSLIKTLGRWESSAYTVYIRTPPSTLIAVSRTLAC